MKKFWNDLVLNPGGKTYSTKRQHALFGFIVATIISMAAVAVYYLAKEVEPTLVLGLVGLFLSYSGACLGLASWDAKQILTHAPEIITHADENKTVLQSTEDKIIIKKGNNADEEFNEA